MIINPFAAMYVIITLTLTLLMLLCGIFQQLTVQASDQALPDDQTTISTVIVSVPR